MQKDYVSRATRANDMNNNIIIIIVVALGLSLSLRTIPYFGWLHAMHNF